MKINILLKIRFIYKYFLLIEELNLRNHKTKPEQNFPNNFFYPVLLSSAQKRVWARRTLCRVSTGLRNCLGDVTVTKSLEPYTVEERDDVRLDIADAMLLTSQTTLAKTTALI